ncbi:DUF1918 domain-containing protein [Streptomyces sp. NPDC020845]|uniref:DUF1918 domain-containing protein n=1 Tax=Streptomyces sp. NPDC020845 TaxID=3365096 RepID=UPI0037AC6BD2
MRRVRSRSFRRYDEPGPPASRRRDRRYGIRWSGTGEVTLVFPGPDAHVRRVGPHFGQVCRSWHMASSTSTGTRDGVVCGRCERSLKISYDRQPSPVTPTSSKSWDCTCQVFPSPGLERGGCRCFPAAGTSARGRRRTSSAEQRPFPPTATGGSVPLGLMTPPSPQTGAVQPGRSLGPASRSAVAAVPVRCDGSHRRPLGGWTGRRWRNGIPAGRGRRRIGFQPAGGGPGDGPSSTPQAAAAPRPCVPAGTLRGRRSCRTMRCPRC